MTQDSGMAMSMKVTGGTRQEAMQDKAAAKARRDALEMEPYLAGLDHATLLHHAMELYKQGQRLRYELDEIMGVIR